MYQDKASITIRIPLSVRDDILAVAISRGVSLSRLATELVQVGFKESIKRQSANTKSDVEEVKNAIKKILPRVAGHNAAIGVSGNGGEL